MRVLWLCNLIPSAVGRSMGGPNTEGLWIDHVLSDIRADGGISLRLLCPGGETSGKLDEKTDYALFTEGRPQVYLPELEARFVRELEEFRPEVIHIWGTEYGHTLAMVRAAEQLGKINRVVISIQGLCSIYARHYAEGVPEGACHRYTLRDFLRQDNIRGQQRHYVQRGKLEQEALKKVNHVIGRTDWDRAITGQLRPERQYYFCNETLREPFYRDTWRYDRCVKHRIFVPSCAYPVKGFHYLLEAMPAILAQYPDATIHVPGESFLVRNFKRRLHMDYYQVYLSRLVRQYGLEKRIEFLGRLDAQGMKRELLQANVFALPSTIENSPNSLGEAMLQGVPCVAADVGGVSNLLHPGEGYLYQSTAPYMLAEYILRVFAQQEAAEEMGQRAQLRARETHNPEKNLHALLEAYGAVAKGAK